MKLDEIEAYAYEVIYPDCDGELFFTLYLAKERASEVGGDIRKLHTPEQMQEYAKAQVAETLKACLQIKIPGRCDGKSAMISEQFKNIIDSIFEEDTKND